MAEPTRRRTLGLLRAGLAVVVVAAVVWAVAANGDEVATYASRMEPGTWVGALLVGAAAPVFTMLGWRALMADLGSPLPIAPASGVFFVGQLGKYVPGSVWSVVAQAEMAKGLGIPRQRTAVVGFVSIGLSVLSGLLIGLPAVPGLVAGARSGTGTAASAWSVLVVLPVLVVVFWPRVLNALVDRGLRILKQPSLDHRLGLRTVLTTTVLFCLAWTSTGFSVFAFADAAAARDTDQSLLGACVVGFGLASAISMLAVFLPAGVGLREGLLIVLLAPYMPVAAATAVVVLTRFSTVLLDVAFALVGWLYARTHHLLGGREPEAPTTSAPG